MEEHNTDTQIHIFLLPPRYSLEQSQFTSIHYTRTCSSLSVSIPVDEEAAGEGDDDQAHEDANHDVDDATLCGRETVHCYISQSNGRYILDQSKYRYQDSHFFGLVP